MIKVYVRCVNGEGVGGEPLHTQRTLKLHLAQLSAALLVPRSRLGVGRLRAFPSGVLEVNITSALIIQRIRITGIHRK